MNVPFEHHPSLHVPMTNIIFLAIAANSEQHKVMEQHLREEGVPWNRHEKMAMKKYHRPQLEVNCGSDQGQHPTMTCERLKSTQPPKKNIVKPKKASKWAPSEADRMQWILSPTGVPNFQHSALLGGQWHEECGDQGNTIEGQFGEQILKAWDRAVEPWIQGTPTNYLKIMGKPPPKSTGGFHHLFQ